MIEQTSFLGISLRTQTRRRALVIAYYALMFAFAAIPLIRHQFLLGPLIAQTFTLGGLLGGIRFGGPVKPYSESSGRDPDASPIQTLNLASRPVWGKGSLLDERELRERDHAHFVAFRILCVTLILVMVGYWMAMDFFPQHLGDAAATVVWLVVVYALSLPQSVILWTEPAPIAEDGLALLQPTPQ